MLNFDYRNPTHVVFGKDRIAELEEELRKAGRRCKLAQVAALAVIVAVTMWAVNP